MYRKERNEKKDMWLICLVFEDGHRSFFGIHEGDDLFFSDINCCKEFKTKKEALSEIEKYYDDMIKDISKYNKDYNIKDLLRISKINFSDSELKINNTVSLG